MKLHRLLAVPAAVLLASTSHAVTLGEIRVNSYLSQPLDAEIEIAGMTPGQDQDLRLRIANDSYLERMGIDYDPFLRDLRFDVVRSGTQWIVRARSSRPVREPFLELPLHMSWRDGQLIRKYTLLFDPPSRVRPATAKTMRPEPVRQAPAAMATGAAVEDGIGVDTYGPVRPGESLWPIAQSLKPGGISTRQMMVALLRANPEAFIGGDMNKLRAGATLHVPLQAFIEQVNSEPGTPPQPAETERPRLTDNVGASPRELQRVTDLSAEQAQPGPDTTAPAEAASAVPGPADPVDRLRIVSAKQEPADEASESRQELLDELLMKLEELETNRLYTNELASRISRLEEKMDQMRQLVALKDAQIATLKSEVSIVETAEQSHPASLAAAGGQTSPGEAAASATRPAPVEGIVNVDAGLPAATADEDRVGNQLHSPYLWAVWGILGMLGLTALLMVWRRPTATASRAEPSLPPAAPGGADLPDSEPKATPKAAAEEPNRPGARDAAPSPQAPAAETEPVVVAVPAVAGPTANKTTASVEELREGGKLLDAPTASASPSDQFSDDDIEAWAKELEFEPEISELLAASQQPVALDEDVPNDTPERDDRLAWADVTAASRNDGIELELIDGTAAGQEDDDAFQTVDDLVSELGEALEQEAADSDDPLERAILESVIHLDDEASDPEETASVPSLEPASADEWHEAEAFSVNLDLARAYLEIGYQEEAKGMLDRALANVQDDDQRRQIEALLKQAG